MAAYHRPTDLGEALALAASGGLTVAAGCTDLYPATQAKSLASDVLDITGIKGLSGIAKMADTWRIGAAMTWSDLLRADLPAGFDGLKLAAQEVGAVQIQNAGTIAGNLCTASPAGDGAPCLLTLDASVELRSAGAIRVLPLQDFLTGPRQTALRPDEIVTAILVPEPSGRGHFLKLGARKYLVISIAMVATRLTIQDGEIEHAAIAVGSCSPTAVRLPDLEDALIGQPPKRASVLVTQALVARHLAPIDDIRADADYRVTAATELVHRSIAALVPVDRAAA